MKKAFSFVEVLIAVTIASTVIAAIIGLAVQNITAAELTRDRFIAANLAQEGIEIVANLRSNNWLTFPQTDSNNVNTDGSLVYWKGQPGCTVAQDNCIPGGTATYVASYNSLNLVDYTPSPDNSKLVITGSGNFCHESATCVKDKDSRFSRTITISEVDDHQMKVTATVSWVYKNQSPAPVVVEDRLYNWR